MKKKKRLSGIERRWFVNNVGVIMLLVLAIIAFCPKLILFLPNLLYGA